MLDQVIRVAATLVRSFPSTREMDEEQGRFLHQVNIDLARSLARSAGEQAVISPEIQQKLLRMLEAWERGDFASEKTAGRSFFSTRNLVVGGLLFLGVGAVEKTQLHDRLTTWMGENIDEVVEIVGTLPKYVRMASQPVIDDIIRLSTDPPEHTPSGTASGRSRPRRETY